MMLARAGKLREMLTLHTVNQHGVHGRFTLKDDCERQFWNAGAVSLTQRELSIYVVHEELVSIIYVQSILPVADHYG